MRPVRSVPSPVTAFVIFLRSIFLPHYLNKELLSQYNDLQRYSWYGTVWRQWVLGNAKTIRHCTDILIDQYQILYKVET